MTTIPITHGSIPKLGLGTWRSKPNEVKEAVKHALKVGYRHIDCAYIYGNEAEVGAALQESQIPRKEVFLTSKLWNSCHRPQHVKLNIQRTLKDLKVDYVDLYLMHWPVAFKTEDSSEMPDKQPQKGKDGNPEIDWDLTEDPLPTWKAMEKLVEEGLAKNIGVSNFNIRRLKKLMDGATIKPLINQVELNFSCAQPELVKWCKENGVLLEAYSPLGSKGATQREEPAIKDLAKKHNVDPANILISWQLARGLVCLPKSITPSRIESNFKIVDLSAEEVAHLEKAAASKPQKRSVPGGWGVDVFEENTKAKL